MKSILSYLCASFFLFFLQGCATNSATPTIHTQNLSNAKSAEKSNPKLSHLVGKNYVKGIVRTLKQDPIAQTWNYEIDGIETTNGKLPYVNFNHKTVLASEGDLVYASFDGMHLTEMFVIKEGFYKNGKRATPNFVKRKTPAKGAEASSGKRDKAHQVLSVPQEESIKLN